METETVKRAFLLLASSPSPPPKVTQSAMVSASAGGGVEESEEDFILRSEEGASESASASAGSGSGRGGGGSGAVAGGFPSAGVGSGDGDGSFSPMHTTQQTPLASRRLQKWRKMLERGPTQWKAYAAQNRKKATRRVRKGIPDELRGIVWPIISGGRELLLQNPGTVRYGAVRCRERTREDERESLVRLPVCPSFISHVRSGHVRSDDVVVDESKDTNGEPRRTFSSVQFSSFFFVSFSF